ncbi:ParB N-terminal domain-containing protein [Paenibacillus sp. FSL R5-0887]|uniref:ParB N-terminal domain-containing protein n=1 Tax=Paenibacillus sp. FSL R5-0887 TaxID=2921662 RepID=UPI0030FC9487
MLTPIHTINIGNRIREDMGDIAGLAESINARGLLHPIVIDESGNLIAGHRRLEAHKLLGREEVETKTIADLTEKEKRLIELEENTKRKALTEFESSKNLLELAEATKEILKEEYSAPGAEKESERGRPSKPDSEAKVAERLGIPERTINEAKHHVSAVEQFPALESLGKKEAIKTAKDPDKVELYQKAVNEFPILGEAKLPADVVIQGAEKLRSAPPEVAQKTLENIAAEEKRSALHQQLIDEQYKQKRVVDNIIDAAGRMSGAVTEERWLSWIELQTDRIVIDVSASQVQRGIEELQRLHSKMKDALKGPRKVVKGRG